MASPPVGEVHLFRTKRGKGWLYVSILTVPTRVNRFACHGFDFVEAVKLSERKLREYYGEEYTFTWERIQLDRGVAYGNLFRKTS